MHFKRALRKIPTLKSHTLFIHISSFILLNIVAALSLLSEYGFIPYTKNGFYCGDPKISFPLYPDTCAVELLMVTVMLLPALTIWALEAFFYRPDEYTSQDSRLKVSARISLLWYYRYILGATINLTIVEFGKSLMGEHRPHFLYSCTPDAANNCTKGEYVLDYKCTNNNKVTSWEVVDGFKSFPSGHTSMSVHFALFMFFYFQERMRMIGKMEPVIITILLQCSFLAFAVFASLSRITDHRHHWWDVLTGFFVGVASAAYSIKILKNMFISESTAAVQIVRNEDSDAEKSSAFPMRRFMSVQC